MTLDIRVPMGLMFTLLGLILCGFGAISSGSEIYTRSLGINVNLWWGMVIFAFGASLLALSWSARNAHRKAASA